MAYHFCRSGKQSTVLFAFLNKSSIVADTRRGIATSFCYFKKSKHKKQAKDIKKKSKDVSHLKREAPFVYSTAIKHQGHPKQLLETPLVFQVIASNIKENDLIDDRTQLLHDLKVKPLQKKETVFIIQPNFKWGKERFLTKLVESRRDEAKALVESIHSWHVFDSCLESVHEHNPKSFFGSGKIIELSDKIRSMINENNVTMVFLNTGKLSLRQIRELEAAWGCKVFDRYRVVLELFKERASTKEAKLQVQLAEVQYLRTHLSNSDFEHDQQRGGGKSMMGGGETHMEKARRQLNGAETKIRKALSHIKQQRNQTKAERIRKSIPQVAFVGYTNAGKTTLAKVLSKDDQMQPEDRLFATLDTTAHQGKLPSGLNALFIDTVGFISDLPHELVESFATTLEDIKTADLIVHVADCSHPEYDLQIDTVGKVLDKMELSGSLQENMLHVLNKSDLLSRDRSDHIDGDSHHFIVSAIKNHGIQDLLHAIQDGLLKSTGRCEYRINIDQEGDELSWLYRHGTVMDATGCDDGSLDVLVILDQINRARFEKHFHVKLK